MIKYTNMVTPTNKTYITKKDFDGNVIPPEPKSFNIADYYAQIREEVKLINDDGILQAKVINYFNNAVRTGKLNTAEQMSTNNIIKIIKHLNNGKEVY